MTNSKDDFNDNSNSSDSFESSGSSDSFEKLYDEVKTETTTNNINNISRSDSTNVSNSDIDSDVGDDSNSDKNSNKTFIAAVLILILFVSIFFGVQVYKINVSKEKYSNYAYYNNYAFVTDGQFWATHVTSKNNYIKIPSYNHPLDLENISIEGDVIDFINSKNNPNTTVYITIDPDVESKYSTISANEYYKILHPYTKLYNFNTEWAILHNPTTYTSNVTYPIIDCINATNDTLVIKQVEGNKERIYRNGSCIILESDTYKHNIRTADRLLFSLLGIMNKN